MEKKENKLLNLKNTYEEIIEGKTKLLVPKKSLVEKVPPKEPAFFNPKGKINRDFSIIAYSSFLKSFKNPKIFLEGLSGLGVRGLRVANELEIDRVIINDLNPTALELAKYSANLNNLTNIIFSEQEVCRFLSSFSKKGERGSIVDIDPFGSPASFFDCGVRATMHGGILSTTATDLQVLNGLFQSACNRKYGGKPIRVKYGNEIAIRLILGCLRAVTGRLGVKFVPLFVESDMHYYRTFVRILNRPDQEENIGYILHCENCGNRKQSMEQIKNCELCESKNKIAGPLWIGKIFEREFIKNMIEEYPNCTVEKSCEKVLYKALAESEMPATYFTLDEVSSKIKSSPPKLEIVLDELKEKGFNSSPTSFCPTGFRSDANIEQIKSIFSSAKIT